MDLTGNTPEPPGMIALNTGTDDPATAVYQANDKMAKALLANLAVLIPMVKQAELQLFTRLSQDFADPALAAQPQNQIAELRNSIAAYRERLYRQALENYMTTVADWDRNLGLPSEFPLPSMPQL
jgi:hypothetical protein